MRSRTPPKRGSKPGPAAKDLQKFITEKDVSIRAASDALGVSHPALIAWLEGDTLPSALHRKKIAAWTGERIPEDAWLTAKELAELAEVTPPAETEEPAASTGTEGSG